MNDVELTKLLNEIKDKLRKERKNCKSKYKKTCRFKDFGEKCIKCNKNKNFICGFEGFCKNKAVIRRQNTTYYEDYKNYTICCEEHWPEIEAYWKERWDEYYSMIL